MGACGSANEKPKKQKIEPVKPVVVENPKPAVKPPAIFHFKISEPLSDFTDEQALSDDKTLEELISKYSFLKVADYDILSDDVIITDRLKSTLRVLFPEKQSFGTINITFKYIGLDIPKDVKQAYIETSPIIGSMILDDPEMLGILTYQKENNSMIPYYFKKQDTESLRRFTSFSAYCSGLGSLYISGGENDVNQSLDRSITKVSDFFCIDLNRLKENKTDLDVKELHSLNETRTWHSMIYVPKKYIFIVGGTNTKSVERYDIEKDEITPDSELNEIRSEATLCLVNDTYLYCICGFVIQQNFNSSIERCNLRKNKRTWEYVNLKTNDIRFSPSFFGVSYFKDDSLLLIGGNDNNQDRNPSYILKLSCNEDKTKNTDELLEYNFQDDLICVFRDKFFTPIDDLRAVNIPLVSGDLVQVFITNMSDGTINRNYYKQVME